MRRLDKEIKDSKIIDALLDTVDIVHIAVNDDEAPYIFTVNFLYLNGAIYFHSANDGKKIELMKKNKKIIFQIEDYGGIISGDKPCRWTSNYQSIIGRGEVEFISDNDIKSLVMSRFMYKFSKQEHKFEKESMVDYFDVVKINITSLTGKEMKDLSY